MEEKEDRDWKESDERPRREHESPIYTGYYFPRDARTWVE
jgi:hypothetical protein